MKKIGAILGLGSVAAVGYGFYKFNDWVYNALLHRDFTVPKALGRFLTQVEEREPSEEEKIYRNDMNWLTEYGYEKHSIVNVDGNKLVGYLMKPEKESDVYVFGSHGYRSDGKGEWCHYAKYYVEDLGFNMFFVDHQAAGESEGEYIGFSYFESRDCMKWLEYMTDTFGKNIKIILHGISMGSTTVMLMTGKENLPENVKFTVADCGFTSAMDEFTYKLDALGIPKFPLIPVVKYMQSKRVGYDFHNDTNALEAVKNAKVPMLFVHGDKDDFVPTFMAPLLHSACEAEYKDILIVPGADHAMSYRMGRKEYEGKVKEFVDKFVSV